ncbi:AraC family transcriptional regulator [Hymenobacter sp. GOD-10R]|uniref:helix-turn-helix domain-containing protein n=1 Tax=Hymenobacter sp. GOD-10R TaxID=3093922 RepID=UPI002D773C65|nr:AraC family transcriptional regulator [Hymenobacter sp. GOD-10R]WRQ30586.1 AraC family transcriptional regulator [Hymenobacter sp. GOD-10R]
MPFIFNVYSVLLLPCFVQGIVISVVLLTRGRQHGTPADGWLALLLLLSVARVTQWMLGFAGWYDSHDAFSTFMFYFPFNNWLAVGPALYFYFRSLTNQAFQFRRRDGWHFAPALLYLSWRLLMFLYDVGWEHALLGQPLRGHFGTKGTLSVWLQTARFGFWPEVLGYVSIALYASLTLRDYRAYGRYVNDNFSDTERIRFAWLRNVVVAVLVGVGVTLVFEVVNAALFPLNYVQSWYDYLFTGILIYYLSIAGLLANHRLTAPLHFSPVPDAAEVAVPAVAAEATSHEPKPLVTLSPSAVPVHTASALSETAVGEPSLAEPLATLEADPELLRWTERLLEHMRAKRPYLAPELTLGELATQLRTNTSWLSRVINTGCGQNFNDFINEYRVQEAERKLRDPQLRHYTLLAVALESGFNSKSTFNRVFRKLRGTTPSEAARRNV